MGARIHYTVVAGQPWQISLQYLDGNDVPVPLAGYDAVIEVRRGRGLRWESLLRYTADDEQVSKDDDDGSVLVRLTGADTAALAAVATHADYAVVLSVPGGDDQVGLARGTFTFRDRTVADQ